MKRLCLAFALATFALHAGGAAAQTYPHKPIRIVAPFVAGGAVDMLARMLGAKLSESFGQRWRSARPSTARCPST